MFITITLYKDTILNDRYATVFDNNKKKFSSATPLERYLSTLPSREVEIDNMYIEDYGTINMEYTALFNPYEYNYMKVVGDNFIDNPRYYFIQDTTLGNNIVQFHYALDVWHTYSGLMNIREGVIGRARQKLDNMKYALPVAYESNDVFQFSKNTLGQVYLVAEISEYIMPIGDTEAESATRRISHTCLIGRGAPETHGGSGQTIPYLQEGTGLNYLFSVSQAIDTINTLTAYQGVPNDAGITYMQAFPASVPSGASQVNIFDKLVLYSNRFTPTAGGATKCIVYELEQVYALPQEMITANMWYMSGVADIGLKIPVSGTVLTPEEPTSDVTVTIETFAFMPLRSGAFRISHEFSMDANPLVIGYGLRSMFIPIAFNNLSRDIYYTLYCNDYGIHFVCENENGITDITEQFSVPIPFTTASGVERQQKAMSKTMAKWQAVTTTLGTVATVATSIYGAGGATNALSSTAAGVSAANTLGSAMDIIGPNFSAEYPTIYQAARKSAFREGIAKHDLGTRKQRVKDVSQIGITGLYGNQSIVGSINTILSPSLHTQGQSTTPDALLNAAYGFGYYYILPNNEVEVQDAIEKIGYSIYLPSNDYYHGITYQEIASGAIGHDIVQFLSCQVSGPFSQSVANQLEDILLAGFRIYYQFQYTAPIAEE